MPTIVVYIDGSKPEGPILVSPPTAGQDGITPDVWTVARPSGLTNNDLNALTSHIREEIARLNREGQPPVWFRIELALGD